MSGALSTYIHYVCLIEQGITFTYIQNIGPRVLGYYFYLNPVFSSTCFKFQVTLLEEMLSVMDILYSH
jgi:hypothetical protein